MHIPENYLSPSTCAVMAVAVAPVLVTAVKKTRESVPKEKMPLLGVAAAFSFLSMMFNIPLPGGTTGHAVCGTLIAILFGPWPATLAVSLALAIQAFFFGDGGILALGANCFNIAFVLPMVGYGVYSLIKRAMGQGQKSELVAAAVGSYVGLNAAAFLTAIEFGIQPLLFTDASGAALYCPYPVWVSVPAMMAGHLTIWGAAEAIFTTGILAFLHSTAPDFGLFGAKADADKTNAGEKNARIPAPVIALVAALVVATPLGLLATGDAWGEWGLEDLADLAGYAPAGMDGAWEWASLMPDYSVGALPEWVGYVLSAVIGVALLAIVFRLVAASMRDTVDFGSAHGHA